jgi:hypothetical protein
MGRHQEVQQPDINGNEHSQLSHMLNESKQSFKRSAATQENILKNMKICTMITMQSASDN